MSEYGKTQLPEGFAEFLEKSGLPCPPLPLPAVDVMEQTDANFFATDLRPVFYRPDGLEDMDALLNLRPEHPAIGSEAPESDAAEPDSGDGGDAVPDAGALEFSGSRPEDAADDFSEEESPVKYAGFGFMDGGLQGRTALYLLDAGSLRICLAMPWSRAFGDPAAERADLEAGFLLAEVCLHHLPASGSLSVFMNGEGCRWILQDGESRQGGNDTESLLDCLEQLEGAGEREASVPAHLWMRV